MFEARWLTNNGPFVEEFERQLAEYLGVKHCIAMCNATVALEIAIRAVGFAGEVIVPSFTFIATAHALQWQEITPVFVDIDPDTHTLDPRQIERMLTPRTSGIIGVHLWGRPCDIDGVLDVARRHALKVLFDAAHAFGCSYKGEPVGRFGNAEVFSFHATKFFNTFEGGAVTTDDDDLAAKIRLMKNFGFAGYDNVIYVGTNGKMTEICAAMGLTSLESVDDFIDVNGRNYAQYREEVRDIPGVRLLEYPERERSNFQYVVLEIKEQAGVSRDDLVRILWAEGAMARRYFYPGCHRMEPYRSFYPHAGLLLPVTERVVTEVLVLPTGTAVDADAISTVCSIIRTAVTNGPALRERLAGSAVDLPSSAAPIGRPPR
jgi:dTDP-4-amino-4,6-dideoxygalactose transaminase